MTFDLATWLNLGLRWLHLTTGIAWIGASFYFVWLDMHLKPPAEGEASGELWSVHGGGFYHKQKYQVAPAKMPAELHWFKWEAYSTFLSGFSLFVLIYYWGAQTYLIDPDKVRLAPEQAIGISLAALAGGWLVYDALCKTRLVEKGLAFGAVWYALLVAAAYGLNEVFNSRAAYLQIGAIIGTVMVANVFFVIIPNQRKVVAALRAGREPDPALGKAGKQRSLHNNYMTLPVLLIMISHHYPMTYGAERPWLVLALLSATGVAIRYVFNLKNVGKPIGPAIALSVVLAAVSVTYVTIERTIWPPAPAPAGEGASVAGGGAYATVAPIFAKHCEGCHSAHPTNPAVTAPPLGLLLDSYEHTHAAAARIKAMAVDTETMPLGNPTGMTKAERAALGRWIDAGAER